MSTCTLDLDAPTFALAAVKACCPARLISSAVQSGLAACFCFNVLLASICACLSFGAFCNALLSLALRLATSAEYTFLACAFISMFLTPFVLVYVISLALFWILCALNGKNQCYQRK